MLAVAPGTILVMVICAGSLDPSNSHPSVLRMYYSGKERGAGGKSFLLFLSISNLLRCEGKQHRKQAKYTSLCLGQTCYMKQAIFVSVFVVMYRSCSLAPCPSTSRSDTVETASGQGAFYLGLSRRTFDLPTFR